MRRSVRKPGSFSGPADGVEIMTDISAGVPWKDIFLNGWFER